jgi:hypothetical protein
LINRNGASARVTIGALPRVQRLGGEAERAVGYRGHAFQNS